MTSTADDPAAELRALRERAYGPDADIHADPPAMARLHELEERARIEAAAEEPDEGAALLGIGESGRPPIVGDPLVAPNGHATSAERAAADPATSGPATADRPHEPMGGIHSPATTDGDAETHGSVLAPQPSWWRGRSPRPLHPPLARRTEPPAAWARPLLWAASLVVAALIGAGAALSIHAWGAGQVAVLHVEEDGEWPEYYQPSTDSQLFDEFHGLLLTASAGSPDPESPTTCLTVLSSDANGGFFGMGGCGAGRFGAIASMVVDARSPRDLRDRFGDGTALQFVLKGDEVRVYADASGVDAP